MNFLYPAFLAGAIAVAVPIVLHLLRRDAAPDVPFTAVRLLRKSPVERSRRRRLRDLLLLAARVTALVLLAAAFARPYSPRAEAASGILRIVAVDRSFSMGAPGRFGRALEIARVAIDEAGFGDRVAVIAFDERADVVAAPGGVADARAALGVLAAGHLATRYASVIDKASELAAGGPAQLVIVTDMQRAGWNGDAHALAPASLVIKVRDVGAPAANLAAAGLRVEDGAVVVSVLNASGEGRQGSLTVIHNGSAVGRSRYDVPASSSVDVRVPWKAASAGALSVTIDDADGFPADNSRYLVLASPDAPAVMVITSGDASGFFLLRALQAAAGALVARVVTAPEIAGGRAKDVAGQRTVVLLSTRNLDRSARDAIVAFVRNGGGLFVAGAPEVDPGMVAAMFGWDSSSLAVDDTPRQVSLAATDLRHPIFRPFGGLAANLGQVNVQRAWRVRPEGWHVPARFSDGSPAVLDRSESAGRVLLFTSDVDRRWNDFPLHPAFVPFTVEAIRYLTARREAPRDLLVSRVPAGATAVPGVQKLGDGRPVAVNVDPRESGIGVMTPAEFTAMIDAAPAQKAVTGKLEAVQAEARQSLWQYGLLLMLLTLVAESFVGRA